MCGIAGIFGEDVNTAVLQRMVRKLAHRGPDHTGITASEYFGLAQSRLSIIDLSSAANQPFTSIDHPHFTIVFNGEIYNYLELRTSLESKGHRFYTKSDTEVLLNLYIEYGAACVVKLRGMFAFAILDARDRKLFIARDRFGIKPLYFSFNNRTFYFASEVRALLEGRVERKACYQSIFDYLSLGVVCNPRTIFEHIHQFPAGCFGFIFSHTQELHVTKYWDLIEETVSLKKDLSRLSYSDSFSLLRQNLEQAVEYHLCSDVNIGSFLSGGIDSSLVTILMSRRHQAELNTFSIGFDGFEPYNEVNVSRIVAEKIMSRHHEKILTQCDFDNNFERLLDSFDQPSMDGTNTFFVSLAAAESGIRVALSGLGGDELMAGYPHYRRLRRLHSFLPSGISWIRNDILDDVGVLPNRVKFWINDFLSAPLARYGRIRNLLHGRSASLISSESLSEMRLDSVDHRYRSYMNMSNDPVELTTLIEVNTYLHDTLLRDSDNMSMSHSLELRPVLLDHELVKTMFALPSAHKLKGNVNKQLLVDAVRDLLPEAVYKRKKMGFEFPVGFWMKRHKAVLESTFSGEWAKLIFSPKVLTQIRTQVLDNNAISNRTWAYFILLHYLDNNLVEP